MDGPIFDACCEVDGLLRRVRWSMSSVIAVQYSLVQQKLTLAQGYVHAALCCRGDMVVFREELWKCKHACLDAKSLMEMDRELYGRSYWDVARCCTVLDSISDNM